MGAIKTFLRHIWKPLLAAVAAIVIDAKTGGKLKALIGKIPVVGPMAVG